MLFLSLLSTVPFLLATSGQTCSSTENIDAATPAWLTDRLNSFGLRIYQFETTGRGLQTVHDRSPGDVVISVPRKDALTASWVLKRFPAIDQAVETSLQKFETKLSDEQVLAAGLLLLRENYEGDNQEKIEEKYIASLPPQQYSVLEMPNELLACLPLAYQKLIRAYQDRVHELHQSLLGCFEKESGANKEIITLLQSASDFQWAFATVRSRCVGMDAVNDYDIDNRIRTGAVDTDEVRIMLPGFDLLNHKVGAKSTHDYDTDKDAYVLRSEEAFSANEQVFISYSDERDNLKMLMTYGFCVEDNPAGIIFFDSHDLLRACSQTRPHYFTAPVLQQIEGLLEKLGKHRDLYEYDGISRKPKQCLLSGIRMMEELEKQFLANEDEDPSFNQDLLNAVLDLRRNELLACIEHCDETLQRDRVAKENDLSVVDWKPMLYSIRTLLQAEAQYIPSTGVTRGEKEADLFDTTGREE